MTIVRKLTESGIAQFRSYLEQLAAGGNEPPPLQLLADPEHSEALNGHAEVDAIVFDLKQTAAEYLASQFAGLDRSEVDYNIGLWSWLSLFYFDQVCPLVGGRRKLKAIVRHIPGEHAWRYYRHLLAGPYRLLRLYGQKARVFLHGPLHEHGDFSEQLASRMELVSNARLIETVDRLYYSEANASPKRGATTRTRPGNLRRLIAVIQQFDLTFDLYAMPSDRILKLLPGEFDRWRGAAHSH